MVKIFFFHSLCINAICIRFRGTATVKITYSVRPSGKASARLFKCPSFLCLLTGALVYLVLCNVIQNHC